jgi:uncharacterized protein YjbJ (UPF0337 family)
MSETTDPRGRTSADIENDVENTRARVSETIDALRGSMSPNQIMDQVVDYARSSGGSEFIRNLGTSVRDNPLPVMMIGAGIGWLLMSGQNRAPAYGSASVQPDHRLARLPAPSGTASTGPGLLERVGSAAASAKDAVADAAMNAKEAVSGAASGVMGAVTDAAANAHSATASTVGSAQQALMRQRHDATDALADGYGAAAQSASRAGSKIQAGWGKLSHEQPLLVGALGLAVGAALGALLPSTEVENRLMGEASDTVTRQVSETAQEHYGQVKEGVSGTVEQVKETLAGAYDDARQTVSKDGLSAHSLGDTVKQAASRIADVATEASTNLADAAKEKVQSTGPGMSQPENTGTSTGTQAGATAADKAQAAELKTPTIVVYPKV